MNLKESIKHLKNMGTIVTPCDGGFRIMCGGSPLGKYLFMRGGILFKDYVWTVREVIALAREKSSDSKQNTAAKRNVKKYSDKKNRAATRDSIQTENFDAFVSKKPAKTDDIWSWD